VDKLSHPEQEFLLEHLARKLGARPTITEEIAGATRTMLQKLDRMRIRGATGKTGPYSSQSPFVNYRFLC
jgi:hypothetical protein